MTRWLHILVLVLLTAPQSTGASPNDNIQVLAVHSYSQEYPWTKRQHESFVQELTEAAERPIVISSEYLDTKRRPYDGDYGAHFAAHLAAKYAAYRPALIYVTDDNALIFALNHLLGLFPDAPVFFSGVNDFSVLSRIDSNRVTGVFEKKEIAANLDLLGAMVGGVERILVVGDGSNTYRAIEREIRKALTGRPDISASFVAETRRQRLLEALAGRPERYLFLTTLGAVVDRAGHNLSLEQVIGDVERARNFVIFSMEDVYLVPGVLGGYVTSGQRQGARAAGLAAAYLAGTPVAHLPPVTDSPNAYMFDHRALQRHGLRLPPDIAQRARILNAPAPFYTRNRSLILGALGALALLLLGLLTLFLSTLSRKNRMIRGNVKRIASQARDLRHAKDRLTKAERIARVASWDWMIDQGRHIWSEGMYELMATRPGTVDTSFNGYLQMVHPEDRERVRAAVRRALEESEPYDIIHRILRPDGQTLYVHEIGEIIASAGGRPTRVMGTLKDVTELKRAERSMQEQSAYLDGILRSAVNVAIVATDTDLRITYYNPTAESLFGSPSTKIMGRTVTEIHAGQDIPAQRLTDAFAMARDQGEYRFSMTQRRETGEHFVDSRISPIWNDEQELVGYMLMSEDVTEQRRAAALIEYQATFDALTDLPNRRLLLDRLHQSLARCRRHGHIGAVLYFDLDNFKHINDSLGHPTGDELLKQVAARTLKHVRDEDTVSRLGGDEFVILLPELGDDREAAGKHAQAIAEKVRGALSKPYDLSSRRLHITPSIGIALFPMEDEDAASVLRHADTAMYRAKEAGRNTYRFFLPDMQRAAEERLSLVNDLRQALKKGELHLQFQPQLNAAGAVIGAEALSRWQHPERGAVSPALFIPLAEETGQILLLGEWVLECALARFREWSETFPHSSLQRIAVNVSPAQFRQSDFARRVERVLLHSRVPPQSLTLELTEGMLVEDLDNTIAKMRALKDIGVRFSIDDFGTGYSSLAYLKRLPLDELKIDRSFVQDIDLHANSATLVDTILTMAEHMGLETLAEGVENAEQFRFLRDTGCNLYQGFHFSPPLHANELADYLKKTGPLQVSRTAARSGESAR